MSSSRSQGLVRGVRREKLRTKGQFWTPDWTADFMIAYVLQDRPERLLDPAVGEGAFLRAAKRYVRADGGKIQLFGRDIDPEVLAQARLAGLSAADLRHVEIKDFVLEPPSQQFPAIIANPPYIRHHRLSTTQKEALRAYARAATGRHIDGRAGLQVYFLIRALQTLEPGGRLAYIVSADICEGVFADSLWQWVCANYRLDAVITFDSKATPFPEVDTNAIVFLIQNAKPNREFAWAKCLAPDSAALTTLAAGKATKESPTLFVRRRSLSEALATGLSRPVQDEAKDRYRLGDFAAVMRGIVTGDNDFFFLTAARARELGIPDDLLTRAVGRTRDVRGDSIDEDDLLRLDAAGRPTFLLSLDGLPTEKLGKSVRNYLRTGEEKGLPNKSLISTRRPWYRMETRKVPPILFAYLGRRDARFIRNRAGAVPLTCLLCVYPRDPSPEFLERLWKVISHPETIANLRKVGKSYGGDAIKVEPRALERLPLPDKLVRREGLADHLQPTQGLLEF